MSQSPSVMALQDRQRRDSPSLDFAEVFEEYQRPIYNYLLRMTQNQHEAEDQTQETFIRVYRNLPTFRGESKLSTWIYRIATNVNLDQFRQKGTRQASAALSIEEIESNGEWLVDEKSPSSEQLVDQSEIVACVHTFVQRLPPDYRAVLVMHDLQGLKNREIADVLDLPLSTVKIRLHRARNKLRAALNACCDFSHPEWDDLDCEPRAETEEVVE